MEFKKLGFIFDERLQTKFLNLFVLKNTAQ